MKACIAGFFIELRFSKPTQKSIPCEVNAFVPPHGPDLSGDPTLGD
jgi:hypothetical protein